jgi:hypothetical protein
MPPLRGITHICQIGEPCTRHYRKLQTPALGIPWPLLFAPALLPIVTNLRTKAASRL